MLATALRIDGLKDWTDLLYVSAGKQIWLSKPCADVDTASDVT